jgi:hypothetical protein
LHERRQRGAVEPDDRAVSGYGHRNRPESARDQLVVRNLILVDVLRRKRHAGS